MCELSIHVLNTCLLCLDTLTKRNQHGENTMLIRIKFSEI